VDGLAVLRKELAEAQSRVKALTSAIAVLGGSTVKSKGKMPAARRAKIAKAMKASWAKKKAGKKS